MPNEMARDPRIRSAVLCDEVRPEANGKLMLLGIYTGDILVATFPASIAVAVYLDVALPEGDHHLDIRLKTGDKIHSGMEGDVAVLKTSVCGLNTPRLPVQLEGETDLIVEAQIDNGPWIVALRKPVLRGASPLESPG